MRLLLEKLRIVGVVVQVFLLLLSDSSRMFGTVLLCCWSFGLLPLASSLVHGNLPLNEGPVSGRRTESSFLSEIERSQVPDRMDEPALLPVDSVEDHFLMDTGSYDEDTSAALQLQGRAMRSPRRCIPHQQSCLGYPLPCCDPCDTCYCRFFNAICYCRRVGHVCPPRRT
ncbi:agouti-related protein isoform X1 [Oreochromis niloticus]|uniref:Agouti-related protein n=2 Tax=Oreochromis niloticus TaxID=8128 RepID=I3J5C4_ORENI|nr:agouti-related protein isoform X1 [Oreochromis niloticus]